MRLLRGQLQFDNRVDFFLMKYMGSKRAMLRNGLGKLLLSEAAAHSRFIDLFSGSGAVATFVATNVSVPVHSFDLQRYGRVLAGAVIERTQIADHQRIWKNWRARAKRHLAEAVAFMPPLPPINTFSAKEIARVREWCEGATQPLTRAYGGHYFSPLQAMWIDALRSSIDEMHTLELAALLDAASECAASPGHTAQPFQPTETARQYISHAWSRDVSSKTRDALSRLGATRAKVAGVACVEDANEAVRRVKRGDLVFVDPPYSALQYSRFYHVLESVVSGDPGPVEGIGRYPNSELRPKSAYSVKSRATKSMRELLAALSERGASVVLTFPDHECSNGLSGATIKEISSEYFAVSQIAVKSRLSTLGGAGPDCIITEQRGARRDTSELILLLKPAASKVRRGRA